MALKVLIARLKIVLEIVIMMEFVEEEFVTVK
jgi:hypothetical protein